MESEAAAVGLAVATAVGAFATRPRTITEVSEGAEAMPLPLTTRRKVKVCEEPAATAGAVKVGVAVVTPATGTDWPPIWVH